MIFRSNMFSAIFIQTVMASSRIYFLFKIQSHKHNKIIKSALVNPCKNETPIKLWWLNINERFHGIYEVDSRLYIAYFICGFSGSKLPFNIKRYVHRTHIFFKVQSFGYYFAKIYINIVREALYMWYGKET